MSSIAELFDKDPLNLTKEDLDEVIKYFREKRHQFKLGDKTAGSAKKAASNKLDLKAVELDF